MTVDLLAGALPRGLKGNATQELADKINNLAVDPEVGQTIRDNFLTYSKVLGEGRFRTEDYLNAVQYVTYKSMGDTNRAAYAKTFPDRYTGMVAAGKDEKTIAAHISMYHKTQLVTKLIEQTLIPAWILFQDVYHKAIKTQLDLMTDEDVSAKVRSDAANSILTHLKPPEKQKIEIDMSVKNQGGLGDLKEMMEALAKEQLNAINGGAPVRAVAAQPLVREPLLIEHEEEQ